MLSFHSASSSTLGLDPLVRVGRVKCGVREAVSDLYQQNKFAYLTAFPVCLIDRHRFSASSLCCVETLRPCCRLALLMVLATSRLLPDIGRILCQVLLLRSARNVAVTIRRSARHNSWGGCCILPRNVRSRLCPFSIGHLSSLSESVVRGCSEHFRITIDGGRRRACLFNWRHHQRSDILRRYRQRQVESSRSLFPQSLTVR